MNATTTRLALAALALTIHWLPSVECSAAVSTYLNIPSISGADPTPGYPNAMAASSATIVPTDYSIIKNIDSASPAIFAAVLGGTPLGTTNLLFYNSAPAGPPTAIINFPNTFATGYATNGLNETDTFSSTTPASLYLEVPGIPGESSTPGHPNIMQIQEFTLAGDFSVLRPVDSASDDIALASAQGTQFPTANLLLYNSAPAGPPDAMLSFTDLVISAYQLTGGGSQPLERVSFAYANLVPQVPEPTTIALICLAAATLNVLPARARARSVRSNDERQSTLSRNADDGIVPSTPLALDSLCPSTTTSADTTQ
jgi:type VI protein secretion system component Hcp